MGISKRDVQQVASWEECKKEINERLGLSPRKGEDSLELEQFKKSLEALLDSRSGTSEALKKRMRRELLLYGETSFSDEELLKNPGNPEK